MRYRLVRCAVLIALFGLAAPAMADAPIWKAGVARAKITPDKPLWLAGYGGRTRPAEGVLHDLWVKVLALEAADGHRGVVVTADLLGFPKGLADPLCEKLRARCGLERPQIMLTCSHTHCGPVVREALYDCYPLNADQWALIEAYSAALENTIVGTVAQALASLAPARLDAGIGNADFAVNRRNNREAEVPKLLASGTPLRGPVDHRVGVLVVRALEGGLRAVVFGYACHNTTLAFYQWCGDYAGFAQIALERNHANMTAMFYEGCGADQNPLPRRSVELCQKYGERLATAVEEVLAKPMSPIEPQLRTAFAIVDLPMQPLPPAEELKAMAAKGGHSGRWAGRMLTLVAAKEPLPTSYPYPVQVWRLGRAQLWVALGGEVVVDYALRLKDRYGSQVWVAGYANDTMAYIPSQRVWKEGGYEQGAFDVYGLAARGWTGDIESRIMTAVGRLIGQVSQ